MSQIDYGPWVATKFGIDEETPVEVLGTGNTLEEAKALCVRPDCDVDYQSYWYIYPLSGNYILTNPEWDVTFEVRLGIVHTNAADSEAQS